MQMFRLDQIRASGMFNGVALSFSKETLRIMQDTVQVHQTIQPEYAGDAPSHNIPSASHNTRISRNHLVVQSGVGGLGVAVLASVEYEICLLGFVLAGGWWLG